MPITQQKAAQIRRLRRAGTSMVEITRLAGVSLGAVQRVLADSPGPGRKEGLSRLSDHWSTVRWQISNGNNLETIAARYSVTVTQLRLWFPDEVQGLGDCGKVCGRCVRCMAEKHKRHQRAAAAEHVAPPSEAIDDPEEIAARIAEVFASWSDEERESRRVDKAAAFELQLFSVPSIKNSDGAA